MKPVSDLQEKELKQAVCYSLFGKVFSMSKQLTSEVALGGRKEDDCLVK